MAEKEKRGIAPKEIGDMPNERRCLQCMRLLGQLELSPTNIVWWCSHCQVRYEAVKGN